MVIVGQPIVTKEELFAFEKANRQKFDDFYNSKGWRCERVYGKANKDYDCAILVDNRWYKVEEKYLRRDGDFLVELVQDTVSGDPGWYYYTKADYIFWGVEDKIYAVSMEKLRPLIDEHQGDFNEVISTKGWGRTKNIAIPWHTIQVNEIGKQIK